MKCRHATRSRSTITISLLAIVGLLTALVPAQVLADRPKAKPGAATSALEERGANRPPSSKNVTTRAKVRHRRAPSSATLLEKQEQLEAKKECAEAYEGATGFVESGQLIRAKQSLRQCAAAACGRFLMKNCAALHASLEGDIPSVVPVVTDASGVPQSMKEATVEVRMDGEPLTSKIDGQAIPVNPGTHEFTFSSGNRVFSTQNVVIVQGQRNRTISARLRSSSVADKVAASEPAQAEEVAPRAARKSPPPEEDEPESGASWSAYALGTVGLLSVGGAGLLTYWGRKDNRELMQTCLPDCNPQSVHHIRLLYLASDVALGVGAVALIASTWIFLSSGGSEEKASAREGHVKVFDVRATSSGAFATLGGVF